MIMPGLAPGIFVSTLAKLKNRLKLVVKGRLKSVRDNLRCLR
jgi:hypothetical protein